MPFPQIEVAKEDANAAIDEEIAAFNTFFQTELKLEPLVRFETACLKTYLQWKMRPPSA